MRMSGRPAILLLALGLPAILSATCNPKKTQPGASDAARAGASPDARPAVAGDSADPQVQACPGLAAAAGPLGPAVAPACPGAAADADPALSKSLGTLAAGHAEGLVPVGPASAVKVTDGPAVLRSAVLQGPPHCYVLVAHCDQGGSVQLSIAAAGRPTPLVESEGPALRICPAATGSYDASVGVETPPATCAGRLYGD